MNEPAMTIPEQAVERPLIDRERIARAVCCGEHGRCILEGCDPHEGELTACIALKGYHDKTIESVFAALQPMAEALQEAHDKWEQSLNEVERLRALVGVQRPEDVARDAVVAAARNMPRATTGPGAASTMHKHEIMAAHTWDLDRALKKLDALSPLRAREEIAALRELYEWYDRDGSVGAAADVFEKHRALLSASLSSEQREVK